MFRPDAVRRIIKAALQPITETKHPLWSEDAEALLLMIAAHESGLGKDLVQIGGGPALGLYQIEPETMWDNYRNFLATRLRLSEQIHSISGVGGPSETALRDNPIYGTIHARLKLYRSPGALPPASDPMAMAVYAKQVYNSPEGAATASQYLNDYQRLVLAS